MFLYWSKKVTFMRWQLSAELLGININETVVMTHLMPTLTELRMLSGVAIEATASLGMVM